MEADGLLSEVMNATVLGKLESKLPVIIKNEWAKLNIMEELDLKSSEVRFVRFMKFLDQQKRIVKFQSGESRQSTGAKSTTNY